MSGRGTPGNPADSVVQCGWCPVMLANDYRAWYRHFDHVHRYTGGYSIRHIVSSDWDTRELTEATRG